MVMAITGPAISRASPAARLVWRQSFLDMAVNVLHHHDRVIDHQADRQHHGKEGQQVDAEPQRSMMMPAPISESGMVTTGITNRADRAQEQEDHHDDDGDRLGQGPLHLGDRGFDELGRVIGDAHLHVGGRLRSRSGAILRMSATMFSGLPAGVAARR
jgi:hypothetical protein